MNHTLKNSVLICMVILYFSIPISNLFALDYFQYKYIIKQYFDSVESITSDLNICLESKSNNFKDRSNEERIVLIYLNTLLDKVISSNKNILDKLERSYSKFCVDTGNINSAFSSSGEGLIKINLDQIYKFLKYCHHGIYDSYIAATLSHELAHDLLRHTLEKLRVKLQIYDTYFLKNKYTIPNEYDVNKDLPQNSNLLEKEYDKWVKFYKSHPDYIKHRQKAEIDADTLGVILYISTGFNPEDFGKSYIATKYRYDDLILYPSIPDIFRTLAQNYITEGESAIKEKRFHEFMESIKYITSNDTHPTDFWRYWNAKSTIKQYQKHHPINLDSTLSNTLYFKIDLSKDKNLAKIKTFFSNPDNLNHSIEDENDPRVYIIENLLRSNFSLDYTLEFFQNDNDNIGRIQKDSTILLRANDIFQIILAKEKEFNPFKDISCPSLFSTIKDSKYFKILYSYMKKAFL